MAPKSTVIPMRRGGGGGKKPVEQHKKDGTFRPARHAGKGRKNKGTVRLPAPPEYLRPTARELWLEMAPKMDSSQICTEDDVYAFRMMVQSVDLAEEAYKAIRSKDAKLKGGDNPVVYEEPITIKHKDGSTEVVGYKLKPRPEVNIIATHQKIALYHFSRFGMTPADRDRVSEARDAERGNGGAEKQSDPLDEFGGDGGQE